MRKLFTILLLLTSFSCLGISKAEVYRLLLKHEVQHPKIVMKQICLESAHLTSKAARVRNNILGLVQGKRVFKDVESCIRYYKRWQMLRYKGNGDYYTFLLHVPILGTNKTLPYSVDKHYITKLKRIKV